MPERAENHHGAADDARGEHAVVDRLGRLRDRDLRVDARIRDQDRRAPEARLERPALEPGRPRTQSPNCMRIRQGTHGKIELMFGRSTGAGKSKTLPG